MRISSGLLVVTVACLASTAGWGENVEVVTGANADPIEVLAADELCRYLNEMFGIAVSPVTQPSTVSTVFLVGRPEVLPEGVLRPEDLDLPGCSPQGILIRPLPNRENRVVWLTGGSPQAVLWAVYELVERWGVRYLVHEDVLPGKPVTFALPESPIHLEPNLRTRCWRLVNDLADGPVSWSLEENERFIRQINKMKYNRVFLSFWPCQPFVQYSFRGVSKPPATLFFNEHFPIDEDTVGREKFGSISEFTNPDLQGASSPEDLVDRGIRLAHGILKEARRLGMETGIMIQPFEWPKEFAEAIPGAVPATQLGGLTICPGPGQTMDDPDLRDMVATVIRAYIETYPEADYLHMGMPEHRGWTAQAEQAYAILDTKYRISELGTFQQLCERARARTSFPGGGERVETMLKGDLAAIAFLDALIQERNLLTRGEGQPNVRLVLSNVVEELFPVLARMIPPGGEVLSFVDYTASRQLRQLDLIRQRPPEGLPANLIFTLADDNVGVLPQMATGSLHQLMGELRSTGWSGFYTRYWTVSDMTPTVHYLARASWNDTSSGTPLISTPEAAYRDLVGTVCGEGSVAPALEAFALLETITKGLDDYGLGFGFPVPTMMTQHYGAGGLSQQIRADHERYRRALESMRAARAASAEKGRLFLDHFVARLTFAVRYLDAAEYFGATGVAEKSSDIQAAVAQANLAYTAIREALQSWADVAEDHGDLGAVALMNQYCYRPIRDKRDAVSLLATTQGFTPPDYNQYPAGLAGYTGLNRDEVLQCSRRPAVRTRIGRRGLYKTGLTQLKDGTLLVCPCHSADDGKWHIDIYRSTDEGSAWTRLETAGDELLGKEPAIHALEDGGALVVTSHPHGFRVSRSDDNGITWKTFPIGNVTEDAVFAEGYSMIRNVLQEPDGQLTLLMSQGVYYNPSAPPSRAWLYRSEDGGRSWTESSPVSSWNAPDPMFDEASVVRLQDGRLLATSRLSGDHPLASGPPPRGLPTPSGDESGDHMVLWESSDNGVTWNGPRDFLGYSEVHGHLLILRDGRILCCYSSYHLPYGVFAIFSGDGGRTWDRDHPVLLALSMNCYTGWPVSVELAGGDILTAYAVTAYLESEGVSLLKPGKNDTAAECVRWKPE